MGNLESINIIGKLFIDDQYRNNYLNATDIDQFLSDAQGLDDAGKQFLRDKKETILTAAGNLNIKYGIGADGGPPGRSCPPPGRKSH
jgi:hypothetical protein